ncbi:MAG: hypothetical protein ACYC5M_12665 [Anaerolineae bacterium]
MTPLTLPLPFIGRACLTLAAALFTLLVLSLRESHREAARRRAAFDLRVQLRNAPWAREHAALVARGADESEFAALNAKFLSL